MVHPLCSPDLEPRDIDLLLLIIENLAGRKFSHIEHLAKTVNLELHAFCPSDFQNAFESWRRRPGTVCKAEESTLKECEYCR